MDNQNYPELAGRMSSPIPPDMQNRAEHFAIDVLIGFRERAWGNEILVMPGGGRVARMFIPGGHNSVFQELKKKWPLDELPDFDFMCTMGLLEEVYASQNKKYKIGPAAIQLLDSLIADANDANNEKPMGFVKTS